MTQKSNILRQASPYVGQLLQGSNSELVLLELDEQYQRCYPNERTGLTELEIENFDLDSPVAEVQASAVQGCHLCTLLWHATTVPERELFQQSPSSHHTITIRRTWRANLGVFITMGVETGHCNPLKYPLNIYRLLYKSSTEQLEDLYQQEGLE